MGWIKELICDERGSGPANVLWAMLVILAGGIGIDTNNAFWNRTAMQATADSAALAMVIALPGSETDARAIGLSYVEANMPASSHGSMIQVGDFRFGRWDKASGSVLEGQSPADAVIVLLEKNKGRSNPVWGTFLRLLPGFESFDVTAASIAVVNWRRCPRDEGLIAAERIEINNVNIFGSNFCMYGGEGVQLSNGNDFTGDGPGDGALIGVGTQAYADGYVSGDTCKGFILKGAQGSTCNLDSNPGLAEAQFWSDMLPTRVDASFEQEMAIFDIILSDANDNAGVAYGISPETVFTANEWIGKGNKMDQTIIDAMQDPELSLFPRDFFFQCKKDRDVLDIPEGDYRNLRIATNCMIDINGGAGGAKATYENVEFVSTSEGKFVGQDDVQPPNKGVNIRIGGNNQFGGACTDAVHFKTVKSIRFAGNNEMRDVRITALQDVIFAGNQDAGGAMNQQSVTAHAGGSIYATSTSEFSFCETFGPDDTLVQARTRLVL